MGDCLFFATIFVALAFGYLLGSIPFGLLLTKFAGTQDLRSIGSGNIGATNVLRTGRKDLAIATLLLDGLKATVAVLIAQSWSLDAGLAAGGGAFLGHLFPVWLNFKGGKGVATFIGALIALYWPAALAFVGIWIVVAFLTRYSSMAALVATACTPVVLLLNARVAETGLFMLLGLLLIYKHRENITRMMAGSESKIGQKS